MPLLTHRNQCALNKQHHCTFYSTTASVLYSVCTILYGLSTLSSIDSSQFSPTDFAASSPLPTMQPVFFLHRLCSQFSSSTDYAASFLPLPTMQPVLPYRLCSQFPLPTMQPVLLYRLCSQFSSTDYAASFLPPPTMQPVFYLYWLCSQFSSSTGHGASSLSSTDYTASSLFSTDYAANLLHYSLCLWSHAFNSSMPQEHDLRLCATGAWPKAVYHRSMT